MKQTIGLVIAILTILVCAGTASAAVNDDPCRYKEIIGKWQGRAPCTVYPDESKLPYTLKLYVSKLTPDGNISGTFSYTKEGSKLKVITFNETATCDRGGMGMVCFQ